MKKRNYDRCDFLRLSHNKQVTCSRKGNERNSLSQLLLQQFSVFG